MLPNPSVERTRFCASFTSVTLVTSARLVKTILLQAVSVFVVFTSLAADRTAPSLKSEPVAIPHHAPESYAEMERQAVVAKVLPVPEPAKTPFDSDPNARKAYLDSFRSSYRAAWLGGLTTCCIRAAFRHAAAIVAGHADGQNSALRDYPERIHSFSQRKPK
jgi:hypothetical protein